MSLILYLTCAETYKHLTLREKRPYSELFWRAFSRIRTQYEEIPTISLYSVQMHGNADQKNSEYGHFPRSVNLKN